MRHPARLTSDQRSELALFLLALAADLVHAWHSPEARPYVRGAAERVSAADAAEQISRWLRFLPARGWEPRLPHPDDAHPGALRSSAEKSAVAAAVISYVAASLEEWEGRYRPSCGPEVHALSGARVRSQLAVWLRRLPGTGWDDRLPLSAR